MSQSRQRSAQSVSFIFKRKIAQPICYSFNFSICRLCIFDRVPCSMAVAEPKAEQFYAWIARNKRRKYWKIKRENQAHSRQMRWIAKRNGSHKLIHISDRSIDSLHTGDGIVVEQHTQANTHARLTYSAWALDQCVNADACVWVVCGIAVYKCVWPVHGISCSSSVRPMYRQRCAHAAVRCDCMCVGVSDRSAQYTLSWWSKKKQP